MKSEQEIRKKCLEIDLKLQELGEEHEPITMERLEEGTKHVRDIAECQRVAKIYY